MSVLSRKAKNRLSVIMRRFSGDEDDFGASGSVDELALAGGIAAVEEPGRITERELYRYRKQRGVNLGTSSLSIYTFTFELG